MAHRRFGADPEDGSMRISPTISNEDRKKREKEKEPRRLVMLKRKGKKYT